MKTKVLVVLLILACLLAAGTGAAAWSALTRLSALETSTAAPRMEETAPTQEAAEGMENLPLSPLETLPNQQGRIQIPAILKLSKQKGGSLEAEHYIRRDDIATITFLSSLTNAPEDAWDASEEKNGAILAWTVPSTSADGLLDLYIGSNQRISAGSEVDLSDFYNLRELNNLNLLDTSGITSLRYAFYGMAKDSGDRLELDLSGLDVSSVTDFSFAFQDSNLDLFGLPVWDVSSGTDFSYMFSGTPLTTISLSRWDMSRAQSLRSMFDGCTCLEAAILDGWNLSSATSTAAMFFDCRKLCLLSTAGWELPDDCLTDHMLYDCRSLSNLDEIVSTLKLKPEPTQADFTDKLSELTTQEFEKARAITFNSYCDNGLHEGDMGLNYPELANLDLDKDGKRDSIHYVPSGDEEGSRTFELHLGNGNVTPLEFKMQYAGYSIAFLFGDVNQTGKDDLLVVFVSHSTAGNLLDILLFTDSGDRYYKQELPKVQFYLEDVQNDYARLVCSQNPHREIFLLDGAKNTTMFNGEGAFAYYFPDSNGKADDCRIRDVKMDGNRLIVLYSIMTKSCQNPFGVVWRLEPGGYFVIERMGTDVIRDYWLMN